MAIVEVPAATMKFNPFVTSDESKNCKEHFNASPHICRKIISSPLSKKLRQKYNVRSMPIQKDEIQAVQGYYKGEQMGKAVQVYRKKYVIYTERIYKKAKGTTVHVGTQPNKMVITRLKLDKDCKKIKPNLTKQERKRANIGKKQLRRYGNKVILYTTLNKNC